MKRPKKVLAGTAVELFYVVVYFLSASLKPHRRGTGRYAAE